MLNLVLKNKKNYIIDTINLVLLFKYKNIYKNFKIKLNNSYCILN